MGRLSVLKLVCFLLGIATRTSDSREVSTVGENVRFYALELQIAFSEALYGSISTDFRLIEAMQSLQIESRHLLDH